MPRLPSYTSRDETPPELREAFDGVAELRNGVVSGPFGVLVHSPELATRAAQLSNYVRWNSALTPQQRETAIITVARHFDAVVMWFAHARLAREAGVREEVIGTVSARSDTSALTEEEAEIVEFVRELFMLNRVTDTTFDTLRARLGDQGIVDLVGLVGYYAFVGATLNAFEIDPPDGPQRLPWM